MGLKEDIFAAFSAEFSDDDSQWFWKCKRGQKTDELKAAWGRVMDHLSAAYPNAKLSYSDLASVKIVWTDLKAGVKRWNDR